MGYHLFCYCRLARRFASFKCEWLFHGEWVENKKRTLALEDALMDYGDYSFGDEIELTPEVAEELIQNGTIVLNGNIGNGTYFSAPKTITLCDWEKPKK